MTVAQSLDVGEHYASKKILAPIVGHVEIHADHVGDQIAHQVHLPNLCAKTESK